MATRLVIVVGDKTTGGGVVTTGSPFTDIDGYPVARIGDWATCPLHGGVFRIITGDVTFIVDGEPLARHGDSLACGCKLISGRQFRVFLDEAGTEVPTHPQAAAPAVLAPASFDPSAICAECLKAAAASAPAFMGR